MDKSRQQFEEWFNENGISAGWCSKRDLEFIKNKMYQCWQASRDSLEFQLPKKCNTSIAGDVKTKYYFNGINEGIDKCKKILISNGVKIKNE
ncbi:hypothetical protein AB7X05_04440 [Providencia rettgeri]